MGLVGHAIRIMVALFHNPDEAMTPATLSEDVMLTRSAMTSVWTRLKKSAMSNAGLIRRSAENNHYPDPSGHKFLDKRLPGFTPRFTGL